MWILHFVYLGHEFITSDSSLFYRFSRSSRRMLHFVKDYVLYGHLTYKDDDLFRNGSVHEW